MCRPRREPGSSDVSSPRVLRWPKACDFTAQFSVAVVPWHPALGIGGKRLGVPLQLGQVVERVRLVQLARVDQTHEQIANLGPIPGLVEQGVLAVQDRLLQGPLAHVVVQRRPGLAQEQRQLLPVLERIADRAAEGRIRLGTLLPELPFQPTAERLHHRPARFLMESQTGFGRQPMLPRHGIVAINHGQRFEQVAGRLPGKRS